MTFGIDLSPLQNAHRMRGIGYTLLNFLNTLTPEQRAQYSFVFFVLPEQEALFKNPLELVSGEGFNFEVRELKPQHQAAYNFPGRLRRINGLINRITRVRNAHFGFSRIDNLSGIDVFLQADQNQRLPSGNHDTKKVLIIYDLIPYILEQDYLWSYKTARLRGCSHKGALRFHILRVLYLRKQKINAQRADCLLSISSRTTQDFIDILNVPQEKITTIHLGVSDVLPVDESLKLQHYQDTVWGYIKRDLKLDPAVPYLLYVGGADSRRKLEDVVAAFNTLRANGHKLKLVLAGDIMLGPSAITTTIINKALKSSSYLNDIIFMGFVDDQTRSWLYNHALVYIFPSRYEGFGLPVLEAMSYGCPVISYRNDATVEVAGNAPIYVDDLIGLTKSLESFLSFNKTDIESLRKKGITQVQRFSWEKTVEDMMKVITS